MKSLMKDDSGFFYGYYLNQNKENYIVIENKLSISVAFRVG